MLERLSEWFYDPLVFWGVPLALALMGAGVRCARARLLRREASTPVSLSPPHGTRNEDSCGTTANDA